MHDYHGIPDDPFAAARGLAWGLLLSLPLWGLTVALIVLGLRRVAQ